MRGFLTREIQAAVGHSLAGGQAVEEEWRPVVGFEGYYEVSSLGRICRIKGGRGHRAGKMLKTDGALLEGYHSVNLRRDGKGGRVHVHIVVAMAFHGPKPTPTHEVNHKDGNKLNNRADNLEWVTKARNVEHAYELGLKKPVSLPGVSNPAAKLTPEAVAQIRADGNSVSQRKQAARFGVSKTAIVAALNGDTWK